MKGKLTVLCVGLNIWKCFQLNLKRICTFWFSIGFGHTSKAENLSETSFTSISLFVFLKFLLWTECLLYLLLCRCGFVFLHKSSQLVCSKLELRVEIFFPTAHERTVLRSFVCFYFSLSLECFQLHALKIWFLWKHVCRCLGVSPFNIHQFTSSSSAAKNAFSVGPQRALAPSQNVSLWTNKQHSSDCSGSG